jgi:hypothetical protein
MLRKLQCLSCGERLARVPPPRADYSESQCFWDFPSLQSPCDLPKNEHCLPICGDRDAIPTVGGPRVSLICITVDFLVLRARLPAAKYIVVL